MPDPLLYVLTHAGRHISLYYRLYLTKQIVFIDLLHGHLASTDFLFDQIARIAAAACEFRLLTVSHFANIDNLTSHHTRFLFVRSACSLDIQLVGTLTSQLASS